MINALHKQLVLKLEQALRVAKNCPDRKSDHYANVTEFRDFLKIGLEKVQVKDHSIILPLIICFTPTYDWDYYSKNSTLRNAIYLLLIKYRISLNKGPSFKGRIPGRQDEEKLAKVSELDIQDEGFDAVQNLLEKGNLESALQLAKKYNFSESEITEPWNDIIKNIITSVDKTKIENLRDLFSATRISFFCKSLSSISPKIGCLTNLISLDLSNNKLKTIPKEFGNLLNLETLILTSNQLSDLPPEIYKLKKLKYLAFSRNKFVELPWAVTQLTKLENLFLYENELTQLPTNFGCLKNLKKLLINKNQLSSLPTSFGKLVNLEELHISYNLFSEIPSTIATLIKLRTLFAEELILTSIPKFLEDLPELNKLFVNTNLFTAQQKIRFKLPPIDYNF